MTNHPTQNGRFMDFVSSNTTRRAKPTSVTTSKMPLISTKKPTPSTSTTVSRFSAYSVVSYKTSPSKHNSSITQSSTRPKTHPASSLMQPAQQKTPVSIQNPRSPIRRSEVMPRPNTRPLQPQIASKHTEIAPQSKISKPSNRAVATSSSISRPGQMPVSRVSAQSAVRSSISRTIQRPVAPNSPNARQVKCVDQDIESPTESTPAVKVDTTPKVSFINIDKVDKRPLSPHAPSESRKNIYERKSLTKPSEKSSTTIISTPSKGNSISLAIAIFLTITLGIALGFVAYFAVTQR